MTGESRWQEWRDEGKAWFSLRRGYGLLVLSHSVYLRLERPEEVILLYEEDRRRVGVRGAAEDEPGAIQVWHGDMPAAEPRNLTMHSIPATRFRKHHDLHLDRGHRYPAHDYGAGVWGFSLDEGHPMGPGGWPAH